MRALKRSGSSARGCSAVTNGPLPLPGTLTAPATAGDIQQNKRPKPEGFQSPAHTGIRSLLCEVQPPGPGRGAAAGAEHAATQRYYQRKIAPDSSN